MRLGRESERSATFPYFEGGGIFEAPKNFLGPAGYLVFRSLGLRPRNPPGKSLSGRVGGSIVPVTSLLSCHYPLNSFLLFREKNVKGKKKGLLENWNPLRLPSLPRAGRRGEEGKRSEAINFAPFRGVASSSSCGKGEVRRKSEIENTAREDVRIYECKRENEEIEIIEIGGNPRKVVTMNYELDRSRSALGRLGSPDYESNSRSPSTPRRSSSQEAAAAAAAATVSGSPSSVSSARLVPPRQTSAGSLPASQGSSPVLSASSAERRSKSKMRSKTQGVPAEFSHSASSFGSGPSAESPSQRARSNTAGIAFGGRRPLVGDSPNGEGEKKSEHT